MIKPFIRWAGGKTKLLSQLRSFIPETYNKYIEPFLGGAALFFDTNPSKVILSDINKELINLYIVLRDNLDELVEDLKKYSNDEECYYKCRGQDRNLNYRKWSNVERASRILYLNKTCWNGLYRVNSSGYFNVPFGKRTNPNIIDRNTLKNCSETLEGTDIYVHGFEHILNYVSKNDFVYLDPPYAPLKKDSFIGYSKEGFGEQSQIDLKNVCDMINKRGAYFVLSNSYTPFILDLYNEYNINTVYAPRFINSDGNNRGAVKEVIITN